MHKTIFVTGSTGYIGENLLNLSQGSNFKFIKIGRSIKEFKLNLNKINNNKNNVLLHLATHYSKDVNENIKIYNANIKYGKNLLNAVDTDYFSKIIYVNTMFGFYSEKNIRDLYYTKTKQDFSKFLKSYSAKNSILYEELYLDSTFGNIDKRNKIIPIIIKSILNYENNPIKNKDASINLMYIEDVVKRILISLDSHDNYSSSFINTHNYYLDSIFEFLKHYSDTKLINKTLLHEQKLNYIKDYPTIDYKNLTLTKFHDGLIKTFKIMSSTYGN